MSHVHMLVKHLHTYCKHHNTRLHTKYNSEHIATELSHSHVCQMSTHILQHMATHVYTHTATHRSRALTRTCISNVYTHVATHGNSCLHTHCNTLQQSSHAHVYVKYLHPQGVSVWNCMGVCAWMATKQYQARHSVLQCVTVYCSVLQYDAVCCSMVCGWQPKKTKHGVVCRSVLQRTCSVLQCVAVLWEDWGQKIPGTSSFSMLVNFW